MLEMVQDRSSSFTFFLNDRPVEVRGVPGTTTLLRFLRDHLRLTGTKEGCAEGDCGACSVALLEPGPDGKGRYRSVDACLVFLPMVAGRHVLTVEGLRDAAEARRSPEAGFHPVQQAMVEHRGSQCGYCTPGVVLSLFELCYRDDVQGSDLRRIDEQLAGNLCRCTGYRPIRDAAVAVAGLRPSDAFRLRADEARFEPPILSYAYTPVSDPPALPGQLYVQPGSIEALWQALEEHPSARIVAGGTDVALEVTKKKTFPRVLIGLEALSVLGRITRLEAGFEVGATVRITDLQDQVGPVLPGLEKMLRVFGSRQVRNRATVGGNLCNASPVGDLAPALLALDATVVAASASGSREIPLREFFPAYRKTALREGEILAAVRFSDPPDGAFFTSYKVAKRREMDISSVAAGMMLHLDAEGRVQLIRLAYGGVAATPVRAFGAEAALLGRPWTEDSVRDALRVLERDLHPISDVRGSASFRSRLASNLLFGFYAESLGPDRDRLADRPTGTVLPPSTPPV
jgi:xanthine dehydrogenase small subunit